MKKLFLVCNAHLDPVWLWGWEEGAAAAISTFRTAADFCEQYDGFVFCHNEALLYQWVEEYEQELFERIQKLVSAGKWHIMGGWYLQPDCNIPCGESILRQIIVGREYFQKKFNASPRVAVNFDSFGHSRGLVQILKQCGYTGYLFMRPEKERLDLPARNFYWKGFDGSEVLAHRLDRSYRSMMCQAVDDIAQWCQTEQNDEVSLFTWGIGNHGGGPSRIDLEGLNAWMERNTEIQPRHTTPEEFFEELEATGEKFPVFANDLRPVFVGCYTSQARLKRLHRKLESGLYSVEKMLSSAAAQGLMEYPHREIKEVERDLIFSEFHDIVPGTSIEEAEMASVGTLHHGLDILAKVQMKCAMAMLAGEEKARPEETPVFIYNPHPHPVTGTFSFELMPADQNWLQDVQNVVTVSQNGAVVISQEEKPSVNMNLDWRKRISVQATLKPSSLNRFDCAFHLEPCERKKEIEFPTNDIVFDNGKMQLIINVQTGLVDRYVVEGVDYVQSGAFMPIVMEDDPDPWHMNSNKFGAIVGTFEPENQRRAERYSDSEEITVRPVRIVEDGPVRMVVEAEFVWNNSRVTQQYILPKTGTSFELSQRIFWNEKDSILKLKIPAAIDGQYIGQGMFGSGSLPQDGTECVSQKWCGLFNSDNALTISNTGVYGSHCVDTAIFLSLLRSPAHAAHPIEDRKLVHEERFIPRVDQGEHQVSFQICGGSAEDRRKQIDFEAQIQNEKPFVFSAFPSGRGEAPKQMLVLSDSSVQLVAMYHDEAKDGVVVRLWNTQNCANRVLVRMPLWGTEQEIELNAFQFQTYIVCSDGKLVETSVI